MCVDGVEERVGMRGWCRGESGCVWVGVEECVVRMGVEKCVGVCARACARMCAHVRACASACVRMCVCV